MCRHFKIKKIYMLAILCAVILAGCGASGTAVKQEMTEPATPTEAQEEAMGGKTLVVYYSASGNTEKIANAVAEAAGADIFEIVPVNPYTSDDLDWTKDESRVSMEHENESLRNVELVSTKVPDWDSYDTILIGYPIWWGIAAWPVNGFVEANDFTGKTVIPFCTSASSGIGESGRLLAELAGTGDWQEGMRFSSSTSSDAISSWLENI